MPEISMTAPSQTGPETGLLTFPAALQGCNVLVWGCSNGEQLRALAEQIGPEGQLLVAEPAGPKPLLPELPCPVRLLPSEGTADCTDNSCDLVLVTEQFNLLPDKAVLLQQFFRLLKPGGELYLNTLFADRRLPEQLCQNPAVGDLLLSGALYSHDFRRLLSAAGWPDYRVVAVYPHLPEPDQQTAFGMVAFSRRIVRTFKLTSLEDICEDYGQVVTYNGTLPGSPHSFVLDNHHTFYTGRPERVCGNSAALVQETRFGKYFSVSGDRSRHFGAFPC